MSAFPRSGLFLLHYSMLAPAAQVESGLGPTMTLSMLLTLAATIWLLTSWIRARPELGELAGDFPTVLALPYVVEMLFGETTL